MRALLFGLVLAALAAPAFAHAMLERADPRVGSTGNASPAEIRLQFSEAVEPVLSKVELKTGEGRLVALTSVAAKPNDRHVLIARPSGALAPGMYHLYWRVVSIDTHRTEGDFCFSVGR